MNYEELQRLFRACRTLDIKTLGELVEFKEKNDCNDNSALLRELERRSNR